MEDFVYITHVFKSGSRKDISSFTNVRVARRLTVLLAIALFRSVVFQSNALVEYLCLLFVKHVLMVDLHAFHLGQSPPQRRQINCCCLQDQFRFLHMRLVAPLEPMNL